MFDGHDEVETPGEYKCLNLFASAFTVGNFL